MSGLDDIKTLRGDPYEINQYITIRQPILDEVVNYGANNYLSLLANLTATSYDCRFQLDDMGIDYEEVSDYTMFCMLAPLFSQSDTSILFGSLDLSQFTVCYDDEDVFYLSYQDIVIDEVIYQLIVDYLRNTYGLKRNYIHFGNSMARKFHMEDERRMLEEKAKENNQYNSWLAPLVSALVNCGDFSYNYETVWKLTICQFMDAVKRINKLNEYRNLNIGIYTGNIDTSKIPKNKLSKQLNWMGEL